MKKSAYILLISLISIFLIFSLIILIITLIILLFKKETPENLPVPVSPPVSPPTPPVPPPGPPPEPNGIIDSSDIFFEFLDTFNPISNKLYLTLSKILFGKIYLMADIYIENANNNRFKFKIDSIGRLKYNNQFIILKEEDDTISFSNTSTNAIYYDISSNRFVNQTKSKYLCEKNKELGVANVSSINYKILSWLDINETCTMISNAFIKEIILPSLKFTIQAKISQNSYVSLGLRSLNSQYYFSCSQSQSVNNFFYIDNNYRLLLENSSYIYLQYNGYELTTTIEPNIYSVYRLNDGYISTLNFSGNSKESLYINNCDNDNIIWSTSNKTPSRLRPFS